MQRPEGINAAVAKLGSGVVIAQLVAFATVPIIARLYEPTVIGGLGVFAAVLGILSMMASGRYELAIPLPGRTIEARHLLALCVALSVATSLAVAAILALPIPLLGENGVFGSARWLLPLALCGASVYQALTWWATRTGQYGLIGSTRVAQAFAMSIAQVGLGIIEPSLFGLALGHALGVVLGVGRIAKRSSAFTARSVGVLSVSRLGSVAREYSLFPKFAMPSAVLSIANAAHLPVLMVTALYGISAGGALFLAQKLLSVPALVIGQSAAQVATGRFARTLRSNPSGLLVEVSRLTAGMLMVSFVIYGCLFLVAPQIVTLYFGTNWKSIGDIIGWLIALYAVQLAFLPLMQLFNVLQWQKAQLLVSGLRTLVVVICIYVPSELGWSLPESIGVYSCGQLLMILVISAYCLLRVRRLKAS